jgi:hypothetical protein
VELAKGKLMGFSRVNLPGRARFGITPFIAQALIVVLNLSGFGVIAQPTASPFESLATPKAATRIDELVLGKLNKLGISPANLSSDAVFVRRVHLDVIGLLPTAQEASDFILSTNANKRRLLIDRLLAREEFADYWAMKWSDLLRVKAEFPINLWPNAAQAYHRWIHTSIRDNKPYDQFARELLTSSGSNFRVPPVNFYRAMQNREPEGVAQTVALTFMGVRAEKWPAEKLAAMSAFFAKVGAKSTSEWKEEIIYFDPASTNVATGPPVSGVAQTSKSAVARVSKPADRKHVARATDLEIGDTAGLETRATSRSSYVFPDGKPAKLSPDKDPREVFADWLIDPKNPWFTRNIANRVWSWLLGRGIIHEPDDIRADNPPSNPELLAYLERELVASKYDLKHLYRLILTSQTYQLACVPNSDKPEAAVNFASYTLRSIEAVVLIDSLNRLTGTTEKYTSAIPEPFTFVPDDVRAVELPDGSISSSFLELFGRAGRDTGLESERNNRSTAAQRLHLLNSSHIQRKIEQSRIVQTLTQSKSQPAEIINGLYLAVLSRFPTEEERKVVTGQFQGKGAKSREAAVDLTWALFNSAEFLYRH